MTLIFILYIIVAILFAVFGFIGIVLTIAGLSIRDVLDAWNDEKESK